MSREEEFEKKIKLLEDVMQMKDALIEEYVRGVALRDKLIALKDEQIEKYKKRVAILEGRIMPDYE